MRMKSTQGIKDLPVRQRRFCEEYLKDLNGARAMIRAGYSPRGADAAAARLLRNVRVEKEIRRLMKKRSERTRIEADQVLRLLGEIASCDPGRAFDERGALLSIHKMPEDVRRTIASIETLEEYTGTGENRKLIGYTHKIRFWSKPGALNLLGKHFRLWRDININMNRPTLDEIVAESMKEIEEE